MKQLNKNLKIPSVLLPFLSFIVPHSVLYVCKGCTKECKDYTLAWFLTPDNKKSEKAYILLEKQKD
jgi:hypothetical protein